MTFAQTLSLFAQAGGGLNGGGGGAAGTDAAATAGVIACCGVVFVLSIVLQVFFLLTLSRALKACAPENRTMEPGQVWLSFIPLAGIIFFIMALFKVPESLANEYRDRGLRGGDDEFGKTMAIWYIVTAFVCGLVSPVFFILYWVKIAGYTKTLQEGPSRRDYGDDEDDRPSRRRRDEDARDDDRDDDRPSRRRREDD